MMREPIDVGAIRRARRSAALTHAGGLHARPAIKLTKLAKRFVSAVWIALDEQGPWIDAKSIARVMAMKAPHMATLHFRAEGDDAENAVIALARLVDTDFSDQSHGR